MHDAELASWPNWHLGLMNVMDGSGNGAIFFFVAGGVFLRQMYCSGRCIAAADVLLLSVVSFRGRCIAAVVYCCGRCIAVDRGIFLRQMYCCGRCIAVGRCIFSRQLEGSNGLHRPRFPGKSVAVGILKVPSGAKIQQNRARWKVKDMSTGRGY